MKGSKTTQIRLGKNVPHLTAIQTAPFYAVEVQLSTGKSFGGADKCLWSKQSSEISIPSVNQLDFGNNCKWMGFLWEYYSLLLLGKTVGEDIASHYSR